MKKELKKQTVDQEIDMLERKLARQIVKDLQEQIGPEEEVWVLGLALEREKLREELEKLIREEEEEKELSARCLVKQKDSDLLDGTEVKIRLRKKLQGDKFQNIQLEIDEGYREHEIGYERIFGTNLEDSLIWLGKELNLVYLDLREDSYTSYKKS